MRFQKLITVLLFVALMCSACGSGGGGENNGNSSGNSASGTYYYNSYTGSLSLNINKTNFSCVLNETGTETIYVSYLSSTDMDWDGEGVFWTRTSGTSGDITGSWTLNEDGLNLNLVFKDDGSFTVTGTIDCGGNASSSGCEIVMNSQGPSYLKIVNSTSSKISVYLPEYALNAIVRPGVCELYGVATGYRDLEISRCADSECNTYSSTRQNDFMAYSGQTHTVDVTNSYF